MSPSVAVAKSRAPLAISAASGVGQAVLFALRRQEPCDAAQARSE
ncbi:hypothetical protein GL4_0090 [Methyloceanibacter caenitepidi]|uniref:Uncharacterized protein n=1 Tax=Methyloceanibacter caenitepidi TaxID=1384459 RepID=A0A0A8JYQ2_9HYPH|nr:hypothetical protein GL4_0090 [Methyloceanibacter caenitepidi]